MGAAPGLRARTHPWLPAGRRPARAVARRHRRRRHRARSPAAARRLRKLRHHQLRGDAGRGVQRRRPRGRADPAPRAGGRRRPHRRPSWRSWRWPPCWAACSWSWRRSSSRWLGAPAATAERAARPRAVGAAVALRMPAAVVLERRLVYLPLALGRHARHRAVLRRRRWRPPLAGLGSGASCSARWPGGWPVSPPCGSRSAGGRRARCAGAT